MTWKSGQSGNPKGRPTSEKAFADALRIAVNEPHETGVKKIRAIADKLTECALNGEGWAIQQVADRLDGKPAQESSLTIDDKRESTDWTREELVSFLNDARKSGEGASKANGRSDGPDSVH